GWTATRQKNAATLSAGLAGLAGISTPITAPGAVHVFHQYTIRVADDRDGFVTALREQHGVGSGVYYPVPNHRLPSLARFAPGLDLPETERAAREVVSLPVHPSLTKRDLDRIIAAVHTLAKAGS